MNVNSHPSGSCDDAALPTKDPASFHFRGHPIGSIPYEDHQGSCNEQSAESDAESANHDDGAGHNDLTIAGWRRKKRQGNMVTTSKYDYIKVRVWQGGNYSVLSRFLLSRHLRMASVLARDALEIALSVKKSLVDQNLLDVDMSKLVEVLSDQLTARGYPAPTLARFRLASELRHVLPIVVLLTGPPGCGKSILASNLAARFGLSVVLHTTQVLAIIESTVRLARASRLRLQNEQQQKGVPEVRKTSLESSVASVGARGSGEAGAPEMKSEGESTQSLESDYDISHLFPPPSVSPLPTSSSQSPSASPSILQVPLWHREYATPAALHRDYDCAARVVAKALEAEIRKCTADGKPLIVVGPYLLPKYFTYLTPLPSASPSNTASPAIPAPVVTPLPTPPPVSSASSSPSPASPSLKRSTSLSALASSLPVVSTLVPKPVLVPILLDVPPEIASTHLFFHPSTHTNHRRLPAAMTSSTPPAISIKVKLSNVKTIRDFLTTELCPGSPSSVDETVLTQVSATDSSQIVESQLDVPTATRITHIWSDPDATVTQIQGVVLDRALGGAAAALFDKRAPPADASSSPLSHSGSTSSSSFLSASLASSAPKSSTQTLPPFSTMRS